MATRRTTLGKTRPSHGDARAASLLHAALAYAARGWCVFPVFEISEAGTCSCWKGADCGDAGKHPYASLASHGFKDATTDVNAIRRWWAQAPHANIGIATGGRSGLVVLDMDPRHGGEASLAAFEAEHGPLPATLTVATGGGGQHLCFAAPAGETIASRAGLLPGLDVRADGGYVVAAPSNHISGNFYTIVTDSPLTALPASLLALFTAGKRRVQAPSSAQAVESSTVSLPPWLPDFVPVGTRHEMAKRLGGSFQRQLYTPHAAALEAAIFVKLVGVLRERFEQPPGDVIEDGWLRQLAHAYAQKPAPGLRAQYKAVAETWEGAAGRTDRRVLLAILKRFASYLKRGERVVPLPVLTVATMAGVGHDAAANSLRRLSRRRNVLRRVGRRVRWDEASCYRLLPASQARKGSRSYSSEQSSDPFRLCDNRDLIPDLCRPDGFGRVFPELCAVLREDRGQQPPAIARLAGCHRATAYRLLPRLAKQGLAVLAEDGWRLLPVDEAKLTVAASDLGVLGKTARTREQRHRQRAAYHAPASRRLRERRVQNRAEAQKQLLAVAERYGWPTVELSQGSVVEGERAWRFLVKRSRTVSLWTAKADLTRAVTMAKKHSRRTMQRAKPPRRRSML